MTSTRPADILRNLEHSGEGNPELASPEPKGGFAILYRNDTVWDTRTREVL